MFCIGAVRAADGVMKVGTSAVLQGLKSQAAENLNGEIHGEKFKNPHPQKPQIGYLPACFFSMCLVKVGKM